MKRLPLVIICVLSAVFAVVKCVDSCSSVEPVPEPEPEESGSVRYGGDTLWRDGDRSVLISFGDELAHDGVLSNDGTMLITYTDTTPTDTCIVGLYSSLWADGNLLKVTVGADTLIAQFARLPRILDAPGRIVPGGCKGHRFHKEFAANDSSWECEFDFRAYLPDPHPAWIRQFIATIMRNDIQALFLDNKGSERIIKDYYGITSRPRKVDGIDASRRTPEEIAAHFAKVHERLYRKEFASDGFPPKYDYMMEVTPVWLNSDSTLITYRFYTYTYTMGAHGYPEEYFLTFDSRTGRLLGWKDLMDEAGMADCVADITHRLTAYKGEFFGRELDEPYPAYLDEEDISSNSTELLKERFDGRLYPRPALTRNGLLFSYQPYEAGCFAEGTLHFAVPYDRVKMK